MKEFKKYFKENTEAKTITIDNLNSNIIKSIKKIGLYNIISHAEYSSFDFGYADSKFIYVYFKNTITFSIEDWKIIQMNKEGIFSSIGFDSKTKEFYIVFKENK